MAVQVWIIKNDRFANIFSIKLENTIPKSIVFQGNADNDLIVFGMYCGSM